MNIKTFISTSVGRIVLKYSILMGILIASGLGLLYLSTSKYVDAYIASSLRYEIAHLKQVDETQGRQQLIQKINNDWQANEAKRYYLLIGPHGKKIAGELRGWPAALTFHDKVKNIWLNEKLIPHVKGSDDAYWPVISTNLADHSRLMIAQSIRPTEDIKEFSLSVMSVVLVLSGLLVILLGRYLNKSIAARISTINSTAKAIRSGQLHQRIPKSVKNDEFDELSTHLNSMLDRIEQLVDGMQQVTNNIAHDLRKPLTRIRNMLEIALLDQRDAQSYQQTLYEASIEIDKLVATFNALLQIAQTEAGTYRGDWETVNLSQIGEELAELYSDYAEEQAKTLSYQIEPNVMISGNKQLLATVLNNLLDNAFKYTHATGHIALTISKTDKEVTLCIADNGPGIPQSDYQKVLKRFTRLDPARSSEGNGLGLSLVKAVVELHKGEIVFENNNPGLIVKVIFKKQP